MKVTATKRGFINDRLQNVGDVFEVPDGTKASWFEPVVVEKPVEKPAPVEDQPKPRKKRAKAKKKS